MFADPHTKWDRRSVGLYQGCPLFCKKKKTKKKPPAPERGEKKLLGSVTLLRTELRLVTHQPPTKSPQNGI